MPLARVLNITLFRRIVAAHTRVYINILIMPQRRSIQCITVCEGARVRVYTRVHSDS